MCIWLNWTVTLINSSLPTCDNNFFFHPENYFLVRNIDFAAEYYQSVFRHTSLGLNQQLHEFWDCFMLSRASLHVDQQFRFVLYTRLSTSQTKIFLWRCFTLLEWCKYNPQPKSHNTLQTLRNIDFFHFSVDTTHSVYIHNTLLILSGHSAVE